MRLLVAAMRLLADNLATLPGCLHCGRPRTPLINITGAMSASESTAVFAARLAELGLSECLTKFQAKG